MTNKTTTATVRSELADLLLPELEKALAGHPKAAVLGSIFREVASATDGGEYQTLTLVSECGVRTEMRFSVEVREEHTRISRFRSTPNGRWYASVGGYGERSRFVRGKNGWTRLDDMAYTLLGLHVRSVANAAAERAKKLNEDAPKELLLRLGVDYAPVAYLSTSSSADRPVKLHFSKVEMNLTVDQAEQLYRLLADFGVCRLGK